MPAERILAVPTDDHCYSASIPEVHAVNKLANVGAATSSETSTDELLAFERMLADLSARFANISGEQVETEIRIAQVMLQQFLGFDRSCFSEFQEDGSLVVVSSTAIDGVEPTPVGQLPEQLSWFFGKLRVGQIFVISNSGSDLPPEAAAEAEFCRRTKLVSHLAIPLRIGGRVIGDIAFSSCRENRSWPEDLTKRLKLIGEVFALEGTGWPFSRSFSRAKKATPAQSTNSARYPVGRRGGRCL
jgi:transcriptional regulator with GAF, ATPase, and Fis domain